MSVSLNGVSVVNFVGGGVTLGAHPGCQVVLTLRLLLIVGHAGRLTRHFRIVYWYPNLLTAVPCSVYFRLGSAASMWTMIWYHSPSGFGPMPRGVAGF